MLDNVWLISNIASNVLFWSSFVKTCNLTDEPDTDGDQKIDCINTEINAYLILKRIAFLIKKYVKIYIYCSKLQKLVHQKNEINHKHKLIQSLNFKY
jgi:hypothetical protein